MTETQTAIQKARALLGDGWLYGPDTGGRTRKSATTSLGSRNYGGRTDNARLGPLKEALGPEVLTRYAQERSG